MIVEEGHGLKGFFISDFYREVAISEKMCDSSRQYRDELSDSFQSNR